MYKVSFTGYRVTKLPFSKKNHLELRNLRKRIYEKVSDLVVNHNADVFFCGMALGVDTYAAESVLKVKEKYPEIKLYAVLPCPEQSNMWSKGQRHRYMKILRQCEGVTVVSPEFDEQCMYERNRALVDLCDTLVAVYDGKPGGTQYTVEYAKELNKEVIEIPPLLKK